MFFGTLSGSTFKTEPVLTQCCLTTGQNTPSNKTTGKGKQNQDNVFREAGHGGYGVAIGNSVPTGYVKTIIKNPFYGSPIRALDLNRVESVGTSPFSNCHQQRQIVSDMS